MNVDALSDLEVIARTIDGEAGNQGISGMIAVGSVILNRVILHWQGETTARGVCLHHEQFSCWLPGPDRDRITASCYLAPDDCLTVAKQVLAGTLPDNTNGADSYEVTNSGAYWAKDLTPVAVIGEQSFYDTRSMAMV